ncbi:MAG TPA: hypothetical protein VFC15_11795 [Candidatus Limnocylindrales bacterium]|nr:hypothetical protein [Candidatus Limnocylindrales bacterium]
MSSKADWMVVAGFLLAATGVVLRVFMMMRSSDAHPAQGAAKEGRELLRSYGTTFPKSRIPLLMMVMLSVGLVLLLAGLLLELR